MESKVAPFAATPDPTYGRHPGPTHGEGRGSAEGEDPPEERDLRLVIEHDEIAGALIYRIVDRRTGEVVQQYLREEVLQMREDVDYSAGGVIRTRA